VLPEAPGAATNPLTPGETGVSTAATAIACACTDAVRNGDPADSALIAHDSAGGLSRRERALRPTHAQSRPFRTASSSWTRLRSVRTSARSAVFSSRRAAMRSS